MSHIEQNQPEEDWTEQSASKHFDELAMAACSRPQRVFIGKPNKVSFHVIVISSEAFDVLEDRAAKAEDVFDIMRRTPVKDMKLAEFRRFTGSRLDFSFR